MLFFQVGDSILEPGVTRVRIQNTNFGQWNGQIGIYDDYLEGQGWMVKFDLGWHVITITVSRRDQMVVLSNDNDSEVRRKLQLTFQLFKLEFRKI